MLIPMQSAPRERSGVSRFFSDDLDIKPLQANCQRVARCRCDVLILTLRGVPGIGTIDIFTGYACTNDGVEAPESVMTRVTEEA